MLPFSSTQLRQSLQRLLRSPLFTLLCIATLAVGGAATTTIFSIVNAILLSPLPYPDADRLVGLWHAAPGLDLQQMPQSEGTYLMYRDHSRAFEGVALYRESRFNLISGEMREAVAGVTVTPSLFPVLRVSAQWGRTFGESEGRSGGAPVVVLSHRLWESLFSGDRNVLGREINLDGKLHQVIGVMSAGFEFPSRETGLWVPLELDPARAKLGSFGSYGVGRLREGTSVTEAQTDADRLLADLGRFFPGDKNINGLKEVGFRARVYSLREDVVGDVGKSLWILLGAVGIILLIACANVANLLIVRGEERRRETAIQAALGAPPGQLIGAALTESFLLAFTASALGLLLALGAVRLLVRLRPINLPRLDEVSINGRVFLFTAVVAVLTSLLAGLLPALQTASQKGLVLEIKGGGSRTTTLGRTQRRTREFLVIAQVALASVLLTGSGLMLHSFLRLSRIDPGFKDPKEVLSFQLSIPPERFPNDTAAAAFFEQVIERISALPEVESVGVSSTLPLSGSADARGHSIEGLPPDDRRSPPVLWYGYTSQGYLESLGIPLLAGRTLTRADQEHRTGAVVINERLAKRYWPQDSALGRRLRPAGETTTGDPWYTVVGIVGSVRNRDLTSDPDEIIYYPLLGKSERLWTTQMIHFVVKTQGDATSFIGPVRALVKSLAVDLPVTNVQTMEQLLGRARAQWRYSTLMLLLATMVALTLSAVGIYGFGSYIVSKRVPEFGVRMAIGASRRDIRLMILKESLWMALIGIVVGLLSSVALSRWLTSLLFEVSPLDPLSFALVPLLIFAVVLLSSYLPAERATRVDPAHSLQLA